MGLSSVTRFEWLSKKAQETGNNADKTGEQGQEDFTGKGLGVLKDKHELFREGFSEKRWHANFQWMLVMRIIPIRVILEHSLDSLRTMYCMYYIQIVKNFKTQQWPNNLITKWTTDFDTTLKMYRWQINIWKKKAPHYIVIREIQSKATVRYTTHLLECPKFRMMTKTTAGEFVEQCEYSPIADRNAKWHSYIGRQFGGFLQN